VERRLDCVVLDQHHFENGLAAANFLSLTAKTVPGAEAFWMTVGMLTLLIDSSMWAPIDASMGASAPSATWAIPSSRVNLASHNALMRAARSSSSDQAMLLPNGASRNATENAFSVQCADPSSGQTGAIALMLQRFV